MARRPESFVRGLSDEEAANLLRLARGGGAPDGAIKEEKYGRLRSLVVGCALVEISTRGFASASESNARSFLWDVVGPVDVEIRCRGSAVGSPSRGW